LSNKGSSARRDPGYTGLVTSIDTLPATEYFDPTHYQRELRQIWYRNWVYVCRSDDIAAPRNFRTLALGDQTILVVRGEDGVARAFHNTCRHRGAALCQTEHGRLPPAGIICPYHSWRYSLKGQLLQTGAGQHADDFDPAGYSLYSLPLTEWNGFIFATLTQQPPAFETTFDLSATRLDAWRLDRLVVGHRLQKTIECNWKVFWENYNECLHCPNVHPKLAQLVPIFGRALLEPMDDPSWQDHAHESDAKFTGGLRAGAQSWTTDGNPVGVAFPGLSDADRKLGHVYLTGLPSIFIVAHVDYVRVVRILPLGPEQTRMDIEFLFLPETLAHKPDIAPAVEFTNTVMSEDGAICEVNQRGLHALAHARGVLMPEEYAIRQFQDWVRAQLARA
jgi:glycine betaine catabolism A